MQDGNDQHLEPAPTPLPDKDAFDALKKKNEEEKARDRRFNRIGFWVGMAIAIPSLIYGYLGYKASQQYPKLTYAIYPIKAELQRPDLDEDFKFTYQGKAIESKNVTAVQVAIWNDGTKSIRADDVLEPVVLAMPEGVRILSAKTRTPARSACQFEIAIGQNPAYSGKVEMKWRILEPADGAVIQLIYVGGGESSPVLTGAVEGQKAIATLKVSDINRRVRGWNLYINLVFVAGPFFMLGYFILKSFFLDVRKQKWSIAKAIFGVAASVYAILACLAYLFASQDRTPFGW